MVETRGQPHQKDKVGTKTEGAQEEQRKALPKGSGTRSYSMRGKSLSAKVVQLLPSSHSIFKFLQLR